MKVKGTLNAFLQAIAKRNINKELELDKSTVSNWRRGFYPSQEKQESVLIQLGWKCVREKVWEAENNDKKSSTSRTTRGNRNT